MLEKIIKPEVNIYIETNIAGVRPADGKVVTILEFVTRTGRKATNTLVHDVVGKTAKQAVLEALIIALQRLNRSCEVTVYLSERYVYESIHQGRPQTWKKNYWKNARGNEIAYKELWQQYLSASMMQEIYAAERVDHEYKSWMRAQLI